MSEWRDCDSRDYCDDVREELWALQERTAWQPITCAPRDGKWILAASDEHGVCIVQFVAGDWYADDNSGQPFDDLTHWMPLPDPPKESDR